MIGGPGFAAAVFARDIVVVIGVLTLLVLLGAGGGILAFHLSSLAFGALL